MKEHTRLITPFVALILALSASSGCKQRSEQSPRDAGGQEASTPGETLAPELPVECAEYKADLEKLRACEKAPAGTIEMADRLWKAFHIELRSATRPAMLKTLAETCKIRGSAFKRAMPECF